MKIVCDSCATKYSISDDKVRGKVFKIRCKKCSHIIVVRGTTDAAAAAAPAAATSEGGGWHLVVDGDQVGPLPESEIRARLARGEISGDTYIWKEGFADWLKLSTVAEFSDVASAPPPSEMSGTMGGGSDLFTDSAAREPSSQIQVDEGMAEQLAAAPVRAAAGGGGGLFSAIDAAGSGSVMSSPRAARAAAAEAHDVFGGHAAPARGGGGGDLFAAHAAVQSPGADDGRRGAANHDGGRVESLTAQRHENSVLFSLANLQQLAMPSAAAAKSVAPATNGSSQSEGSGLIDIRAMAATTMGSPGDSRGGGGGFGDDLPAFGSFSSAAPVLLPMPSQSGPPKWIYAVIGGMAVLVVGIGLMAYKILTTKPVVMEAPPPPVAVAPPAPVAAVAAPKTAPAPAAAPAAPAIPDENLPPREGSEAAKAAEAAKHEKAAKKTHGGPGGKEKKASGDSTGKAVVAAPAPEPEKEKEKEKKPAKGSLDDLLENALSGKKPRARPAASDDDAPRKGSGSSSSAAAEAAGPLSKSAVVSGMNSVKPKIAECYSQFKVPGMAMVNVVIAKSGKVTAATVSGKFVGTPTGACVEKAVKSASFPPSEGLTTPYPFTLK